MNARAKEPRGPIALHVESADDASVVSSDTLVARIRAGDRAALAALYERHFDTLWRLAAVMTRDPEGAEDVVQDVFLSLWARRETLDVRGDVRVYLNGAVRHIVYNRRKHGRVVSATQHAVAQATLDAPGVAHPHPQPDAAAESAEFADAYERMIAALDERERIALRLRAEEGFTFEQIGAVLGISPRGAQGVVQRAQQKVRAALARYHE